MNILHLTHTDIRSDSRILKEMGCLAREYPAANILGLGIMLEEEVHKTEESLPFDVVSFKLMSRKWFLLPKAIRHIFILIELVMRMLLRALKHKPRVIHCHDTVVLPLGWLLKKLTKAKLIYDAHELESDKNGQTPLMSKGTLWIEKFVWPCVDTLIVVSPSIAGWYERHLGVVKTEVVMNSPYIDTQFREVNAFYLRDKFNIPLEAKIYIYIGILGYGRGIELILEVFKKTTTQSHVVFLGYGELAARIKQDGLDYHNIHYHEAVPHSQVVGIARSADFGFCLVQNVSLSDYYCLPNKLFEYAFAGLPVLASNFPDISALVQEYDLGKCIELSMTSIGETLDSLQFQEKKMINTLSLYPLSWQAQEEKIINLYHQLSKENR